MRREKWVQKTTFLSRSPIYFDYCNKKQEGANKNIKMSSFKSSENIQKKEGGPDRSVSDNQSSSVTLNELAMKARTDTVICRRFSVSWTLPRHLTR